MFDFLGPAIDAVRPHFEPVDPERGSQGAARPGESDGSLLGDIGQTIGDFGRGISQEGLAGLLDPSGMMDRQDAQRDLASRFNIMPDGTPGIREQNQVSEEQFQDIARTYSDIRMGRGDLTLGARPANMSEADYAAFREGSMDDIADIMQTESGRGLIDSLADAPLQADGTTHRTTTIDPRLDATGNYDPSNATGGGTFGQSGFASYVPGADTLPAGDNLRSDVTLYHELVHAHHAVHNTWDSGTVGQVNLPFGISFLNPLEPDRGLSQAEHQAAGLGTHANDPFSENRYRGERARIGELDVGERDHGAETDDAMTRRDQYRLPRNPDGTPRARTTPATIPARSTTSGVGSVAPGDEARVGRSTADHDHDHHHMH